MTGMRVPPGNSGIPGKNIFKISKFFDFHAVFEQIRVFSWVFSDFSFFYAIHSHAWGYRQFWLILSSPVRNNNIAFLKDPKVGFYLWMIIHCYGQKMLLSPPFEIMVTPFCQLPLFKSKWWWSPFKNQAKISWSPLYEGGGWNHAWWGEISENN